MGSTFKSEMQSKGSCGSEVQCKLCLVAQKDHRGVLDILSCVDTGKWNNCYHLVIRVEMLRTKGLLFLCASNNHRLADKQSDSITNDRDSAKHTATFQAIGRFFLHIYILTSFLIPIPPFDAVQLTHSDPFPPRNTTQASPSTGKIDKAQHM